MKSLLIRPNLLLVLVLGVELAMAWSPGSLQILTTTQAATIAEGTTDKYLSENKKTAKADSKKKWTVTDVYESTDRVTVSARGGTYSRRLFIFTNTHTDFRKALSLKPEHELQFRYTPVDQDPKWTNGTNLMFTKFLRIVR